MHKRFRDRLTLLAQHMETLRPAKFNLRRWFEDEYVFDDLETRRIRGRKVAVLPDGFCKTPACVLGAGALLPTFNKAGLSVDITRDHRTSYNASIVYISGTDTFYDFEAGREFFGLTDSQARLLFFDPSYQSDCVRFYLAAKPDDANISGCDVDKVKPRHVAAALYKFVATEGASAQPYIDA